MTQQGEILRCTDNEADHQASHRAFMRGDYTMAGHLIRHHTPDACLVCAENERQYAAHLAHVAASEAAGVTDHHMRSLARAAALP